MNCLNGSSPPPMDLRKKSVSYATVELSYMEDLTRIKPPGLIVAFNLILMRCSHGKFSCRPSVKILDFDLFTHQPGVLRVNPFRNALKSSCKHF